MDTTELGNSAALLLLWLVIGGLFGAAGQVIRSVAGLNKGSDQTSGPREKAKEEFSSSRFLVTVIIGFVAGMLALLGIYLSSTGKIDLGKLAIMLITSGYAGADFIESFIKKMLPTVPSSHDNETKFFG